MPMTRDFERTDDRRAASVSRNLVVKVSDHADLHLLGQELRRGPIEVKIETAGIASGIILEIPGQSSHC